MKKEKRPSLQREVRDLLELYITDNADREVWQERPYTAVKLDITISHVHFSTVRFSKVHWPDVWDELEGFNMANKKAVAKLAKDLLASAISLNEIVDLTALLKDREEEFANAS